MSTEPIRVLLVDDHLVVRRGLATLLLAFGDLLVVGEAQTGAEALTLCETARPDVVLMDLLMPEMDGVAATTAIRARFRHIQVIVLTSMDEYDLVRRALVAGARGVLVKSMSAGELASKIRQVRAGHAPLEPLAFETPVRGALPLEPAREYGADLTEREREVLARLARGLTNTQIGALLGISRATAKFHVSSILSKLGVASRTQAAALAVQLGLIAEPVDMRAMTLHGDLP